MPTDSTTEHLPTANARQLLQRQDALQAEAERVIADLEAFDVLSTVGQVRQIGSSVTGLMTWRDLDLQVLAPGLSADQAWDVMRTFVTHPHVHEMRFVAQSGSRSLGGNLRNSRYFFQVYYGTNTEEEWKIDVAFWLADDPREDDLTYQTRLVEQLDAELRLAILWIKTLWVENPHRRDPAYGREVTSVDIYDAVVEHDVRTPAAFDAYLVARGKPIRSLRV